MDIVWQLCRTEWGGGVSSDLLYIVYMVGNAVSYTWKLLRSSALYILPQLNNNTAHKKIHIVRTYLNCYLEEHMNLPLLLSTGKGEWEHVMSKYVHGSGAHHGMS